MVSATTPPPLYWITECEHPANKPIVRVCARADSAFATTTSFTRQQVHDHIRLKSAKFQTATLNKTTQKWEAGAVVVLTDNGLWITTTPNNRTGDNLGNLPPCTCKAA